MRRWDGLTESYQRYCQTQGLAEGTVQQRIRQMERWGAWMKRRRPKVNLEEVGSELLIEYIRRRTSFHSKCTVSALVSMMRLVGEHLVREGVWRQNPMRWIRGPKLDPRSRLPRRIGRHEMARLWDAAGSSRHKYTRYLSIASLAVLYSTGMRRGELQRLDLSAWNREESSLRVDGQKTRRERSIVVSESVWRCLEAYLPVRQNVLEQKGIRNETALFVNQSGQRLTGERLTRLIHGLARTAFVPLVSLHQFRHSCASDLLEEGVNLPQVQQILGHAAISSTMRYLQIADPQRHEAIRKHPINQMLVSLSEGRVA